MREPALVPAPFFNPGRCFVCGGNEGEMIDTMVDVIGDGRVYVCVRTCLPAFARLAGYGTPEMVDELVVEVAGLAGRAQALEEELAAERDHKVVSVSDMVGLVERMRATEVDPIAVQVSQRLCSATKVNGEPCTANALPGRDVCVAHSKTAAVA